MAKARDKQLGLRIPHELYRRLKIQAAYDEQPMSALLQEALEQYLARKGGDRG